MPADPERPHPPYRVSPGERRARFGLLLLAIIAAFCVQGIANPGRWERLIVSILLAMTLVLAVLVADARRRVLQATVIVAIALVVLSLVEAVVQGGRTTTAIVANLLLVTLAPPMIVIGVVRTLRERNRVTMEALFGVLCVYLLLGMFFAFVYGVIGKVDGSFFAGGAGTTVARTLYYSFTTMTTVGYGDYTAASNLGHTLSVAEALLGQVYLVTVVSVIVANLGRGRPTQGPADPPPPDVRGGF